jgi:hypothetical protein
MAHAITEGLYKGWKVGKPFGHTRRVTG